MSDALRALREGGKAALARALAAIEAESDAETTLVLLDAAWAAPRAHVVGITGPPGVGKSTLGAALVRHWRNGQRTVGVVAVDPSSRRSGGALLGDRTRLELDPDDDGVFFRSMAARDRLGGIASLTAAAVCLMRAVYDVVLVETVGVGQSETDIADIADSVILAIQPGSGDSLQYMKAGIVEIPDIAIVTKADLGPIAGRTRRELEAALALQGVDDASWQPPILAIAAADGRSAGELAAALERHFGHLQTAGRLAPRRAERASAWLSATVRVEFGRRGLEHVRRTSRHTLLDERRSPFRRLHVIESELAGSTGRSDAAARQPDRPFRGDG